MPLILFPALIIFNIKIITTFIVPTDMRLSPTIRVCGAAALLLLVTALLAKDGLHFRRSIIIAGNETLGFGAVYVVFTDPER